ncbi:MAG: S9 family peptidase, partial [Planctomycetota bacterium]
MSEIPFRRFVEVRKSYAPSLSPDGRTLTYVSDLTGYPEAFRHTGFSSEPLQLTEFRERVGRILWSPDGRRLVLNTDLGGDEHWAIRSVRPDGQDHRTLSQDPSVMHVMGQVSADGRLLSCSTNARDRARFDLGVLDLDSAEFQTLSESGASELPGRFSPDDRFLVTLRMYGSFRQEILLTPLEGGSAHPVTPEGVWFRHFDVAFDPSGTSLVLLTDRERDHLGLARLTLETQELEWLYAPEERDVERAVYSRDGATALLADNVRGWSRLLVFTVANGGVKPLSHPQGVIEELSISEDGRRGAFTLVHPGSPGEVYLADLETGETERATRSPREVPEEDLVRPEEVVYASFDGTEITGLLYLPRGRSGRRPAVVKVHGGPESQARPRYDPVSQYLLSRGFAIYEPNVRGSTGYGRKFAALDDCRLRFDAIRDLAESARFLAEDGRVDPGRISLLGGSYGGFMVLAGLAFFPDLWAAGVSIAGPANLRTFLERTGPYRREWRAAEYGDPEADAEFLDEISPIHRADAIRAPLLVIQGANDPRCPQEEAEQILHAVQRSGRVAQYLLFRDEGHGIVKLENRLKAFEAVVR